MKRIPALFLLLLMLTALLSGCFSGSGVSAPPKEPEDLRKAIEAELNCEIRKDEEGSYQLFHPDAVEDRETFHQVFVQCQSYFPIREGYRLTMLEYDEYRGVNTDKFFVTGWYLVETGGKKYYLYANLASDEGGIGFRQWNLFNEEDYQTWLDSQKQ